MKKQHEELKAKLMSVLTTAGSTVTAQDSNLEEFESPPKAKPAVAAKPKKEYDEDDDESLSFFAKLANED